MPIFPIRPADDGLSIAIIDQRRLPAETVPLTLDSLDAVIEAIDSMQVRGAPLIGVAAAWGLALALRQEQSDATLDQAAARLLASRPTAVNLRWAVERMRDVVRPLPPPRRHEASIREARRIGEEDAAANAAIGRYGLPLIEALAAARGGTAVNILTHCNAGILATTAWGTATAPIYLAHAAGVPLHVWVGETRPRNQGASLTAWEFGQAGIPHAVIADNAVGHLMQRQQVDLCLVGADRVAANGDVINKIGTLLRGLAAREYGVPFHVAFPASTIDWTLANGLDCPIEERTADEVLQATGWFEGRPATVALTAPGTAARNPAFDLTPAHLVTGFITDRGTATASAAGLRALFPEARA